MRELKPSREGPTSQSAEEDAVIFTQVMGLKRPGRVRGFGLGATPSLVFGSSSNMRKQTSQYDAHRRKELAEMNSKLEMMKGAFLAFGFTFDNSDDDTSQHDAHPDKEFAKVKLQMKMMEEGFLKLGFTFGNSYRDSNEALPNGMVMCKTFSGSLS